MQMNATDEAARVQRQKDLLTEALKQNTGNRAWREWKAAAAAEVLALAERAARLEVLAVSLAGDLNVVYRVRMPVPRWPVGDQLVLGDQGVFHLHYQETWRWESPPSWAPLGLFEPLDPFHPNMKPALRGAICLGKLPPGVLPREIVHLGYHALTLQDRTLDETDPSGVMNPMACEFYRQHPEHLPLTRAGLFDPWEGGN